jgi:hypothetical protein
MNIGQKLYSSKTVCNAQNPRNKQRGRGFGNNPSTSSTPLVIKKSQFFNVSSDYCTFRDFISSANYKSYSQYKKLVLSGDKPEAHECHKLQEPGLFCYGQQSLAIAIVDNSFNIGTDQQSQPVKISSQLATAIHKNTDSWKTSVNSLKKFLYDIQVIQPVLPTGEAILPAVYLTFSDLMKLFRLLITKLSDLKLIRDVIVNKLIPLSDADLETFRTSPVNDLYGYFTLVDQLDPTPEVFKDVNKCSIRGFIIYCLLLKNVTLLEKLLPVIDDLIIFHQTVPQGTQLSQTDKHIAMYMSDRVKIQSQFQTIFEMIKMVGNDLMTTTNAAALLKVTLPKLDDPDSNKPQVD